MTFFYHQRFGHPGPKFRQYKPIRAHPGTCVGLGRIIDALLSLAAAFFGGDASSHWQAVRMLGVDPRRRRSSRNNSQR
jgi:hypothetical protein